MVSRTYYLETSPFLFISFYIPIFQVLDAHGVDVTPQPLYHPDPLTGTAKPNKLLTSQEGSFTPDNIVSYSLYQNTVNRTMFGQFTR